MNNSKSFNLRPLFDSLQIRQAVAHVYAHYGSYYTQKKKHDDIFSQEQQMITLHFNIIILIFLKYSKQ